ncbi:response regulator [Methylophaga sp. UBA3996]|uniref:response regulator n=1 Tax=Methylophaga sp. UBA3996 TaxID=1946891 RepID=UPI0025A12B8F|nr:response regulator [Methylophaga sp. UBA3996]
MSELSLLVVDDSLTSRNHIMRIFSTMGILHIDDAENGRKALDKINENHYDLIVTDLNMPEMDGHELVQYIRNDMGNDAIPIMILTTENNEARLGQVEQAGVSAILNKPFEPHTIREMLFRLLDS